MSVDFDGYAVMHSGEASIIFTREPNTNNFFEAKKNELSFKLYILNIRVKYV